MTVWIMELLTKDCWTISADHLRSRGLLLVVNKQFLFVFFASSLIKRIYIWRWQVGQTCRNDPGCIQSKPWSRTEKKKILKIFLAISWDCHNSVSSSLKTRTKRKQGTNVQTRNGTQMIGISVYNSTIGQQQTVVWCVGEISPLFSIYTPDELNIFVSQLKIDLFMFSFSWSSF